MAQAKNRSEIYNSNDLVSLRSESNTGRVMVRAQREREREKNDVRRSERESKKVRD